MVDWNDNTVKLIVYLVYGTSFVAMFLALTFWRKRVSHIELMNDFRYLAIFGLLNGLAEYSDIPRFLAWQPAWIYDIIKLFLVSSSFAALLAFGLNVVSAGIEERRWLRGIPHGALLMYFWLILFMGLDIVSGNGTGIKYSSAELAMRYSLGFLGAAATSYAFFELSGKVNTIAGENAGKKVHLRWCWLCFVCNIRRHKCKSNSWCPCCCFPFSHCINDHNFRYHVIPVIRS